jgi:hypothetical protein
MLSYLIVKDSMLETKNDEKSNWTIHLCFLSKKGRNLLAAADFVRQLSLKYSRLP